MGASAAIVAAVVVAAAAAYTGHQSQEESKKTRRDAEAQAAQQRESLAGLKAEPTPVMPVADITASSARRRSITDQLRRRGRASTILTGSDGPSDSLGA